MKNINHPSAAALVLLSAVHGVFAEEPPGATSKPVEGPIGFLKVVSNMAANLYGGGSSSTVQHKDSSLKHKPKMNANEVTSKSKPLLFDPTNDADMSDTLTTHNSFFIGDCSPSAPFEVSIGSPSGRAMIGSRCEVVNLIGMSSTSRSISLEDVEVQTNFFAVNDPDQAELFCGVSFLIEEGLAGKATVTCPEDTPIVVIVRDDNLSDDFGSNDVEATATCAGNSMRIELSSKAAAMSKSKVQGQSRAATAMGARGNPGKPPVAFEKASNKGITIRKDGLKDGDAGIILVNARLDNGNGGEILRTFITEAKKCKPGRVPNGRRRLHALSVGSSNINKDGDLELDFNLDGLDELLDATSEVPNRVKVNARIGISAVVDEDVGVKNPSSEIIHEVVDMSAFLALKEPKMVVHGGWIRRALSNLSSKVGCEMLYTKWDAVVIEATVSDPNDRYRVVAHMADVHLTGIGSDQYQRRARMLEAPTEEELQITDEMRMGRKPGIGRRRLQESLNHNKILVHGYCAQGNPFPVEQFAPDAVAFSDPGTPYDLPPKDCELCSVRKLVRSGGTNNWSNDVFARKIDTFAINKEIDVCGIIAHSQGGLASIHLYANYWSCLDETNYRDPSRLIQSVGSPYGGTPLAGNLAAIGDTLGVGCGTQEDLTIVGAIMWWGEVKMQYRSKLYYYTTGGPEDTWWPGEYCHGASYMILEGEEDGTTEQTRGQFYGANNMGHTKGQCHTANMNYQDQCADGNRNKFMNANAKYH